MTIIANCVQRPDSTFPVVVKPYKLDISQFGDRVRDKMKFTITNVSEADVSLELVSGLPDLASITLPDKIEAGRSARGEIMLNPEVLQDEFEKSFTFEVLGKEEGIRFTVPVKRSVKQPAASGKTGDKKSGK